MAIVKNKKLFADYQEQMVEMITDNLVKFIKEQETCNQNKEEVIEIKEVIEGQILDTFNKVLEDMSVQEIYFPSVDGVLLDNFDSVNVIVSNEVTEVSDSKEKSKKQQVKEVVEPKKRGRIPSKKGK